MNFGKKANQPSESSMITNAKLQIQMICALERICCETLNIKDQDIHKLIIYEK